MHHDDPGCMDFTCSTSDYKGAEVACTEQECLACIGGCIDRAQGNGEPLPVCLYLC